MTETKLGPARYFRGRPWLFPVSLCVIVALLTIANISGSSVAVYEISAGKSVADSGVLHGQVRPIRSDEWLVRTPWLMSQIHNGLPATTLSGVGSHDASVVGDLPVRSLDILVRPHQITSWFLGPERALAAEWWTWHLLMVSGVFALVFAITRRPGIAACCGLLLAFSPSTQWWVAPGTFTTVGYGSLCGACVIEALNRRGRVRFAFGALGGWAMACFFCTLYIPWMITTAIVVGMVVFGVIIEKAPNSPLRFGIMREAMFLVLLVGAIGGMLILTFVLRHWEAIQAINQTVYPGDRVAEVGGSLNPALIFGSPFDYNSFQSQTVMINGTNQSENSAGIAYIVPVAVAFFGLVAAGLRSMSNRVSAAVISSLFAGLVLMAWALLPLPSYVGQIFLLDRVPTSRLPPALAFVSVIALGFVASLVSSGATRPKVGIVVVSALTFGFVQMWASGLYRVNQTAINPWRPMVITLLLCLAIAASLRGFVRTGLSILLLFSFGQFLQTNPIQRGADALLRNPISTMVEQVERELGSGGGWLTLGGDVYVRGSIEASGVQFVSGISRYPNRDAWAILDPNGRYESSWNRYAHISIERGESGTEPVISTIQTDVLIVRLDPCDGRLRRLGVTVIVTQDDELKSCGRLVAETRWGGRTVRAYDVG